MTQALDAATDLEAGVGASGSPTRILVASLVGTAVEFFDFYIYTTAASLVFGKLFFPSSSLSTQQMASYASFGVAFVARPLGSLVFGHFGDRIGRKSTLVASLLLMGFATVAVGLLPTYAAVGWLAPVLLCSLRFAQGFGLGGEWGGAVLLATENAPPRLRARFAMFPQLGAPVGFIAANSVYIALTTALSPAEIEAWGWRLPFLSSAVLVGLGLWVRLKLTETPAFRAAAASEKLASVPVAELLRDYPGRTLIGILALVVAFVIFYITTAFALGYGTNAMHFDRRTFLIIQLGAIVFMAVGTLVSGVWADRTSPRHVIMAGCGWTMAVGFLMQPLMGSGSVSMTLLFLSLALFGMGLVYGPAGALLSDLFPPQVRYTGSSIGYNTAGIVGGGLTPLIAQALADHAGLGFVGLYLGASGFLSLVALLVLARSGSRPSARVVEA